MHQPIAGSVDAIAQLREAGHRVLFVTNNSFSTVADQEQALEKIGVSAKGEVCTSSQAAGLLLSPKDRVLLGGGPGVMEAIIESGATLVARSDDGSRDLDIDIDAVVVGYHNTFDYWGLLRLAGAVRSGARLIATNDDATYPTPNGLIPGGGSILAAIVEASGVRPTIGGKPHEPMAQLVRQRLGIEDLSSAWMVGDRASTDGVFARQVGCRFAKIALRGRFKPATASPQIGAVEVNRQDFLLGVFELHRHGVGNFLDFAPDAATPAVGFVIRLGLPLRRVVGHAKAQQFGHLLGDGRTAVTLQRATACGKVNADGRGDATRRDAKMRIEPFVFGGHDSMQ